MIKVGCFLHNMGEYYLYNNSICSSLCHFIISFIYSVSDGRPHVLLLLLWLSLSLNSFFLFFCVYPISDGRSPVFHHCPSTCSFSLSLSIYLSLHFVSHLYTYQKLFKKLFPLCTGKEKNVCMSQARDYMNMAIISFILCSFTLS